MVGDKKRLVYKQFGNFEYDYGILSDTAMLVRLC